MRKFNLFLNYIATSIIAVAVFGVLWISFSYLSTKEPKTETLKIEYQLVANDSLVEQNKIGVKRLDSLLNSITVISSSIQTRQLDLIKDKENDNFFNKLYTAIIAIILAIAGFFGFKSISEIKTNAIEDAKDESSKIAKQVAGISAKDEFNRIFDVEYRSKVFDEATKATSAYLRNELGELEKIIFELEERILELEEQDKPINVQEDVNSSESGKVKESKNPFDNE